MDETDLVIFKKLMQNSRLAYRELAEEISKLLSYSFSLAFSISTPLIIKNVKKNK